MRLDVIMGIEISGFKCLVTFENAPAGTIVAIVGIRASCQPIPVLRIVAPASSIAFASITISSQLLPSAIKSSMDKR